MILPSLANKGPILVVKELVDQLTIHGYRCSVYYFDEIIEIQMKCETFKSTLWGRIPFEKYDIVHSHGMRPDMYVFFHRPLNTKTKFITTLHNYVIKDFGYQYNKITAYTVGNLWMLLLRRHDIVVTLSKDAMVYYSFWFKKSKLRYAYNTRDISIADDIEDGEKNKILAFKLNSILIGVNSLLTRRKGIDMLIKALVQLPQCKLYIIGNGYSRKELYNLALKYGVIHRCKFLGYKKDAYRYLSFYDIYAIPSRSEGFPLSILEAAIFKCPVVCSNISIFKEAFTENEVSFFELENIESLVQAIIQAIDNKKMGELLYQKYINMYSPKKMFQQYMDIYNIYG
ncbi:4-alpha-N-acetylgalactosaminyltransferase [termite gut metagenome]|uniref:4-alpha-N-acetylgalactosaminyltransferase n=1 Tax=termite gut metagenome TaxID=433724 RepID=A0A5J4RHN0_9ZZZZ